MAGSFPSMASEVWIDAFRCLEFLMFLQETLQHLENVLRHSRWDCSTTSSPCALQVDLGYEKQEGLKPSST